jgi:hypothetical protein
VTSDKTTVSRLNSPATLGQCAGQLCSSSSLRTTHKWPRIEETSVREIKAEADAVKLGTRTRVAAADSEPNMTLTASEVRALPAVVDVVTAAQVLGIGRTVAYELVRTGAFPTPVLRVGGQVKIPTAPLLDLLGLAERPLPPTPPDR